MVLVEDRNVMMFTVAGDCGKRLLIILVDETGIEPATSSL